MKVIINRCFGGFELSDEAYEWLIKNRRWRVTEFDKDGNCKDKTAQLVKTDRKSSFYGKYWLVDEDKKKIRTHKDLIDCVETIGSKRASGRVSELEIVEVPNNVEWEIDEYDGNEWVAEKHRRWS